MKKLLTLLSAATVAIGLYADDFATGTSFEGLTAGDPLDITDTSTGELSAGSGSGYFWATNGTVVATVKAEISRTHEGENDNYPSQFAGTDNYKVLAINSTFGSTLARNVTRDGNGFDFGNGVFFFDSLVKFTAFEDDPMNTAVTNDFNGAKIAVWIQEVSEGGPTNLYVRAGYLGGDATTYDCGAIADPEGWHRLTIKAIPDIYKATGNTPAFVVFVDNNLRGSEAAKGIVSGDLHDKYLGLHDTYGALFPSMDQVGQDYVTLKSVAFDGQGEIDDIVFTETVPFEAAEDDNNVVYIAGTGYETLDAAIFAVTNENSQIAAGSVFKLVEGSVTAATDIDFTGAQVSIVLDLNGKALNAITAPAGLHIIDSTTNAVDTIGAGIVNGTVDLGDGSQIDAGKYEDIVTMGDGSLIYGGRFKASVNEGSDGVAKWAPSGYTFAPETGNTDYLVLVEFTGVADVDGTPYATIAEALAAATAGQTVTLNADVTADAVSTAAGTIDLNGKTLTLSGTTAITFTGTGAKTLKGGDLMGVYNELTVTVPAGENLTFDSMTFHASVKPNGSGDLLTATNCQFLCDFDKTGTAFTDGSSADVHSYGLLFYSDTLFAQADVVNNYFDQGRRAAVQASIAGDLYFYGNTVVADKLTSRVDGSGTRYPALQIISNGGVFIENNSFSGQYLGEAFCVYNKGTYRTTDAPIVFSGNTVANDVAYLWGIYDVDASGSAALVNPDIYFGANTIGANVDLEHCIYKTTVDGIDMNGVTYTYAQNLALPAGVASVYAWTHAAGAKPYYVNGAAADAIAAGTVIAVPGVEVTSDTYVLTPDATFKNQYTAVAGEAKVGSTPYLTFKDAVDAADTGDTVTVLKDCSVTNGNTGVTFTKGINLVNNYTITIDGANYALRIANGTTTPVTWSGTGSLVWAKGSGSPILVGVNEKKASYGINDFCEGSFVLNGGYLTSSYATAKGGNLVKLEAGTFTLNDGTINGGTRGVKADSEGNNAKCVLTINGGTIVNTNSAAIAASTAGSGSSTITVNAGTFTGAIAGDGMVTIPGTSTAKFDRDQTKFCATGYETVLSDGWYVVQEIPSYTITFISGEGSTTNTATYLRDATVDVPTPATVTGKTFTGWDKEIVAAAADATYTALYAVNTYTIKFVYGENLATTNEVSTNYGVMPTVPTSEAVAVEGKNFDGWDAEVVAATADATYIAQYSDATPAVPTIDPAKGGSAECGTAEAAADAAAAINADKATYITAPEGIDTAAYYSKVEAKVVGTSVVLGIAESAEAGVKTAAETSAADVVTGEATAITVAPGLYYKVSKGTSLPIVDADPITGRSTTGTTTTVTKPGTTQGFIKVEVDAKPFDVVE